MSVKINFDKDSAVRKLKNRRSIVAMTEILAAVRGDTITQRAIMCGVSRQTYYSWLNENTRPNPKQAHRLANLTGYSLVEIMGRD